MVDAVAGSGCAVISVAALLILPVLTAGTADSIALDSMRPLSSNWWLVFFGLVLQALAIVWVGRSPRVVLVIVAAVGFGISWFTPAATTGMASLAVLLVVFLTVLRVPLARLGAALGSASALFIAGEIGNGMRGQSQNIGQAVFTGVLQGLVVIGIPLLVAQLIRSKREAAKARSDEQLARTGERDAQIEAAIARERTAMARELHDIAAHHLSGIALMAAAVDRQIDTSPAQARLGVQQLRAQSTTVLDDLRRIVGLLREDDGAQRSVQTLDTVTELVDDARAQGRIDLRILTTPNRALGTGIGPLTQLALYRTIQEALTNAANHAAGATRTVEIDDRDDARAQVSVVNAKPAKYIPPSPSGGFGLLGMQERADLVGADLRFGPTPEGGWQIRISVPREAPVLPDNAGTGVEPTETPWVRA